MFRQKKVLRGIAQAGLVLTLTGGAGGLLTAPAFGADPHYGNRVNNCYGIWWNTDWNQDCPAGARYEGYYKSVANCAAPQIPDKSITKYRPRGNKTSYDGPDCAYGIHWVQTSYWS